jgi:hypothetical protein
MARCQDGILDGMLRYDGVEVVATTFATAVVDCGRIIRVGRDMTFSIFHSCKVKIKMINTHDWRSTC